MPSSPALSAQSDDSLFRPKRPADYETIETVALGHIRGSSPDGLDSLPPISPSQGHHVHTDAAISKQDQHLRASASSVPQPPSSDISTPPRIRSVVQVAASSPMNVPTMKSRPGILASAMAPAGTTFRRPAAPAPARAPQNLAWFESDALDSSDSEDRRERERNSIKPKTFVRKSDTTAATAAAAPSTFSDIMAGFVLSPEASMQHGVKRSADTMANAYGNVQKKARQQGPARAMPVQQAPVGEEPMEIEDIMDPGLRNKVMRLRKVCSGKSVRDCYNAIKAKHGNFDDAADFLLTTDVEIPARVGKTIDLTGSGDELAPTPAAPRIKSHVAQVTNIPKATQPQQIRKPVKSIQQKWSNHTQQSMADKAEKRLDVFDTPPPQPIQKRRLVQGRRNRSPSPTDRAAAARKPITVPDDSEDEADSGIHHSGAEDGSFNSRLLEFFNTCTAMDLCDMSGIKMDQAEHIVSKRPFQSIKTVREIEAPNLKHTGKNRRSATTLGERVEEKVSDMMTSYEAVDYLVNKCQRIAQPLASSMKVWGVDVYGKNNTGDTGLDLVNVKAQSQSSHDSGIGTPISDDGSELNSRMGFIQQPKSLAESVVMKDYQIVGLNWLRLLYKHQVSGILADDMGLGKTLQTIAFIAYLAQTGDSGPHLIVVPSATLENWLKEFARFAPSLRVEPYYGSLEARAEMRFRFDEERDRLNVIVTTYKIAKAKEDIPWLRNYGFTCAVYDEAHQLKNPTSEVARKLMRIKSKFRLLLTGTPLQNNLNELMGLLKFLMPAVFEEKAEELEAIFKQQIGTITGSDSSREMLLSQQRIARARSMLTPFILRRKKWQVLKDLPPKTRHVEYCDLTPEQTELYNLQLAKAWDVRERKARGERIPADENANVLIRLRQAAIHPLLFRYYYTDKICRRIAKTCPKIAEFAASQPEYVMMELAAYADFETDSLCSKHALLQQYQLAPKQWEVSGKVTALLKFLDRFKAEKRRTLIFSQFVMVLDILEKILSNHSIGYYRLDGSTKVEERQDLIDEFNAPDCPVDIFMLSTKAGGAGINLASASRVIVFDSGFNPQDDVQAENRAHRIGQTQDVEVWRLVTRGTVEEQIYDMGLVKLQLDQEVAGEAADVDAGDEVPKRRTKDEKPALTRAEQEGASKIEEMLFAKLESEGSPRKVQPTTGSNQNTKLTLNLNGRLDGSSSSSSSSSETDSNEDKKKKEKKKSGTSSRTSSQKSKSGLQKNIKDEENAEEEEDDSPLTSLNPTDIDLSDKETEMISARRRAGGAGKRAAALKAQERVRQAGSRERSLERAGSQASSHGSQQSTISRSGRLIRRGR